MTMLIHDQPKIDRFGLPPVFTFAEFERRVHHALHHEWVRG
jgi:hypothetical protein